ncbi:MAG: hypothetical protein ACOX6D_10010 [Thermoguttaceae bacterium]
MIPIRTHFNHRFGQILGVVPKPNLSVKTEMARRLVFRPQQV